MRRLTANSTTEPRPRTPLLRRFGRTGLSFPEIGLGTWTFSARDFGPVDDDECARVVRVAHDLGLRFLDTADVYGRGRVERLLGDILDAGLGSFFVSTKVGNDFRHGERSRKNFEPGYVASAIAESAARLRRPVLDLVHLHNPPGEALRDDGLLGVLRQLKRDGAVRFLALSTVNREDLEQLVDAALFDAVQIPFNLLRQDLLLRCRPALKRWGGAVIVRTPLEFGLLGGKLPAGSELATEDFRRRAWDADEEARKRAAAAELRDYVQRSARRTLPQAALQATLLPDVVSTVIPGCRSLDQLLGNVAVSRELPPLTRSELLEMDRIIRGAGLESELAAEFAPAPVVAISQAVRSNIAANIAIPSASVLAQPLRMGSLLLSNRIIRSGTTERAGDADGLPTEDMRNIHRDLARGGAGMVITGYLAVEPNGRASASHCVLCPGPAVDAWKAIVRACREVSDARLCAQLGHGGALSLTAYDQHNVVSRFRDAACAAAEAGFDAVQLHAAHGYLLGQLLSEKPALRDNPDDHAGRRLFGRIIEAVADAVRPDLAVLIKANVSDFVPGGYDTCDAAVFAGGLPDLPIDAVEWSGWTPTAHAWETPSRLGQVETRSEGFFVPFAAAVKRRCPGLVVGTCGGFRTAAGMARAIFDDGLDFVTLARPLIAEPDLPRKLLTGEQRAYCDGCNQCLAKNVRPVHCPKLGAFAAPLRLPMGELSP
jgi:aryl-alcohol dehydrogenase-like predicted oxidoreductase/2,4-dienoyl-CoA reductase-like NADH-dependent reductase (Old Yellow Enzyme family)